MTSSRIIDIGVEILRFGVVYGPFLSLTKPQRGLTFVDFVSRSTNVKPKVD